MASPSHFLPFSLFLTSSLLQSQFFTWLSQALTISLLYLVFWFALQHSLNRFSKSKPQPPPMLQAIPFSTSNAQLSSSLSTPLSVAIVGVQSSPRHYVLFIESVLTPNAQVIVLCFSSFFFVSLVGFICYGNQMLKSNKPKDL